MEFSHMKSWTNEGLQPTSSQSLGQRFVCNAEKLPPPRKAAFLLNLRNVAVMGLRSVPWTL